MSKGQLSFKKIAVLTGVFSAIILGSVPVANAAAASAHRIYPGSDDTANQKAREQRNAPNMYCEKHQEDCE